MDEFVKAGEVAGVVTLVADDEKILHLTAQGFSDVEKKTPLAVDSLFWIASMTKPITGTAVMMMQEEGKLSVNDPVSKYIPEFALLKDAAGNQVSITIQQCLSHTCGLSELSNDEVKGLVTLKETMPLIVAKPVKFTPGSKWHYCQTGINTAARIVEIVSEKSFPDFLEERLFKPLGMKDTSFYPTEEQVSRLAKSYRSGKSGGLEESPISYLAGQSPLDKNRFPRANGGLFSTAEDYMKFSQMILRGGELGGKRYLKEESIKRMTSVLTGELEAGFTPGSAWGLGWSLVHEPQGVSKMLSPGSFGHGGAYGTQAWIDPVRKRIYLLMIQRADIGNGDASKIRKTFQETAAQR